MQHDYKFDTGSNYAEMRRRMDTNEFSSKRIMKSKIVEINTYITKSSTDKLTLATLTGTCTHYFWMCILVVRTLSR